ncbi:MAG TPA: carboxypeptidase-like regulatory domain-containing protein [Kofleriaceae bacterium]|jgi:hypothetical protein|nr:carboxypeptidase-like regulatory domain-containing protein [Kofleriaceae bacterium]
MNNRQCIIWSFVAVASHAGCHNLVTHVDVETPTIGSDRASVTGLVLDSDGAPVVGATVTVRTSGEHATSDSMGAFTLDVPANTTLTLSATAPNMAPTQLQQFLVSPGANAVVEMPLVTIDHFKSLAAMGANPAGGVVAVALKSMSGTGSLAGATVQLTPSLGRVMYAPTGTSMADPDPAMAAVMLSSVQADESYAWALGVQPHVSAMQLTMHGVSQIDPPYAIDDVTYPGTFTVDAGTLTLVTLFTK